MLTRQTLWEAGAALVTGCGAALLAAAYAALLLAGVGVYRLLPCLVVAAVAGVAVARWVRGAARRLEAADRVAWLVAALIACATLALTLPPGELLLGGWDPGVYLHTGAAVARGGSLQIMADGLQQLPPPLRAGVVEDVAGWVHPFRGMFLLPNGRLSPQFMHLYPSLLAVAYGVAGTWGALLVNPVLNVFCILACYGVAARLLGRIGGVAAALLLAVNAAQVWQARFATAEMLTQLLLLLAARVFLDFTAGRGEVRRGIAAGALLGLALLARYDTILLIVPLLLLVTPLALCLGPRRGLQAFLLTLALLAGHAVCHLQLVAPCYRPLARFVVPLLWFALLLGLPFSLACLHPAVRGRLAAWLVRRVLVLRLGLTALLAALLFLVLYVRPRLTAGGAVTRLAERLAAALPGGPGWRAALPADTGAGVVYLQAVLGPAALLVALAGLVVLIWRLRSWGAMAALAAALAAAAVLVTHVFNDPFLMWVSRRFVPVVFPLLTLALVAAAQEAARTLATWRRCRPLAAPLAAAMLAAVLLPTLPATAAMASTRDWPGLVAWCGRVAGLVPPGSQLFCDQPGFAAPLRFLHGVQAWELRDGAGPAAQEALRRLPCDVYYLTVREPPAGAGAAWRLVARAPLFSHTQRRLQDRVPDTLRPRTGRFSLYLLPAVTAAEEAP